MPYIRVIQCKFEDWNDTTLPYPSCDCLKREGIKCANVQNDVESCPDYEPENEQG